jgi:hypothetical protein
MSAPGRRERRVALDDLDAAERNIEFLGHDLRERSLHAGAEIDLAGVDRHRTRRIDGEEGVDGGQRQRLRRSLRERAV